MSQLQQVTSVTARGECAPNVDVGMGFAYPVLVEDASLQK